jgi:hypothetical protein
MFMFFLGLGGELSLSDDVANVDGVSEGKDLESSD